VVEIKCRTIPKPREGTRPVYRKNAKRINKNEPFIQGNLGEELDYLCGNCGRLLAENVSQGEISIDIVFECPNCQAYNESYNVEPRPIT
jgi:DNA-directed RNA polymerase subunit RPC12/RpoP